MNSRYRTRIYGNYTIPPLSIQEAEVETQNAVVGRAPYLNKLINEHFPSDLQASIYDLGCGQGELVHIARGFGYKNMRGVDGSISQLAAANRHGFDYIEEGDVLETLSNIDDYSCDCIVMFDVIEHFTRDEIIDIVDHVRRVLKNGGRWILHTPNAESPFSGRIRYGDITHEMSFTCNSIAQLMNSSGFSSVKSYEDQPIPHGLKSTVRWVLWKFIRNLLRLFIAVETGNSDNKSIFSQNFLTVIVK